MASEIYVKLSEMDRPSKPVNDSDLVFIAQADGSIIESKAMTVSDLRALLNFENAYTTTALGLADTTANQFFFVFTDTTKTQVKAYINRAGVAEVLNDPDGSPLIYRTRKGLNNLVGKDELINPAQGTSLIAMGSGETIANGLGHWLAATTDIFDMSVSPNKISTRGFYTENDGGAGVWNKTGTVNLSLAGKHIVTEGKVYNKIGVEYLIDISKGEIDPLANGAMATTYNEVWSTKEDVVCLGDAINGIFKQVPIEVYTANTVATYTGYKRLRITLSPNLYRICKNAVKIRNGVTYDMRGSTIYVVPTPSNSYPVTGKKLNGFQHGYDEVKEKFNAVNGASYWGSVSCQNVTFLGGDIRGDLNVSKTMDQCSSGVGILIINPEYVFHDGVAISMFTWCAVAMAGVTSQSIFNDGTDFDDNEKDYRYILDFMGQNRFGNFYGANYENCRFHSGWRGVLRSSVDWSYWKGGICTSNIHWQNPSSNKSGTIPSYTMVVTGTGFDASGAYISNNGGLGVDCNPKKGIVYTVAKGHSFTGLYTEWTYRNFVISKFGYNDGVWSRSCYLHIGAISQFKDDNKSYYMLSFEDGSFGYYDNNTQEWVWPTDYTQVPTPVGVRGIQIGTPVRDEGAFLHGGYDFKYGPYNVGGVLGELDFDTLRDIKQSKEFLNPYGLSLNSGVCYLPFKNLSKDSVVHIWLKDLTGNFDPKKISIGLTGNIETTVTNNNDFVAYGETVVDFKNGYKLITVFNKRPYGTDGVGTWTPQISVYFQIDPATPIILKAVEAYTGGVSVFPGGCDYTPQADLRSIMSSNTYAGVNNGVGGGIFKPGDIIRPYIRVDKHNNNFKFSPTIDSNYSAYDKIVKSGMTLDSVLKTTFTAQITAVDSVKGQTSIKIPDEYVKLVVMGIPLYISSGSSTSVTDQQRLIRRLLNSDGTYSSTYVIDGIVGAVNDNLVIDQTKIPSYTFYPFEGLSIAGSLSMTSDNSILSFSNNGDLGFLKKSGAPSKVAIGSGNSFIVTTSNKSTMSVTDTFTDVFKVAANGVVTVNNTVLPNASGSVDFGSSTTAFRNGYFTGSVTVNGNPVGTKVTVPSSATSTGSVGQWAADTNYFYVCIAANTWVRAQLATW